eukprot:COSAG04_NODE_10157_length_800_cov_0.998573_1_plen_84_part_10
MQCNCCLCPNALDLSRGDQERELLLPLPLLPLLWLRLWRGRRRGGDSSLRGRPVLLPSALRLPFFHLSAPLSTSQCRLSISCSS